MRLIKAQNTNLRNIYGKGVKYDVNDQVIVDSNNCMLVPVGTTAQRPTSPQNGHLRYNTDANAFEVYEAGAWVNIANTAPAGIGNNVPIVQQDLGIGDSVTTLFGPLDNQDDDYPDPAGGANILVFVENVFQLHNTNYTLVENPGVEFAITSIISVGATTVIELDGNHGLTTGDSVYIEGVETDPDDNIEFLNTDYSSSPAVHGVVSAPAADQLELTVDTTSGVIGNYIANSGRLITYIPGYYIQFNEAPPAAGDGGGVVPITVLHNFDK